MKSSIHFKISSSLMCLLFMATSGFANGEIIKWMKSRNTSNHYLETKLIRYEEDTVERLNRRINSPIISPKIVGRKNKDYTKYLNFSLTYEIQHTLANNPNLTENPQKNGEFGAQMRGGKVNARGYREMRGYRELDAEGQFFEDSEVVDYGGVVQVFPNPAKDWIAIYLSEMINVKQILLHDMTGTIVKDWQSANNFTEPGLIKISTESISPGTYTLRIIGSSIASKPIRVLIKK